MVNNIRKVEPEVWNKVRDELKAKYPAADPEKLVRYFTMKVAIWNAVELRPIFEATNGKYGYVSMQINPNNSDNAVKMLEEVEFVCRQLSEEFNGIPNVVFKVPGTKAAFSTVERLTSQGIGVNITACCSVGQFLKFGEIIEKGISEVSFITMMSGRFDDPKKDELVCQGVDNAVELSKYASAAVIRRIYDILHRQRKMKRFEILTASLRGPWNIES